MRSRTAAPASSSLPIHRWSGRPRSPRPPRSPSERSGPKTRTPIPSAAARRAPSARTSKPCSAPYPSRAIVTGRPGATGLGVGGGGRRVDDFVGDDLAAGVGAACLQTRCAGPAVAARAATQRRLTGLVVGAPLVAPGTRGSLLRDRHRSRNASGFSSRATHNGQVVGLPGTSPPDQSARSAAVSGKSKLSSIGVTWTSARTTSAITSARTARARGGRVPALRWR